PRGRLFKAALGNIGPQAVERQIHNWRSEQRQYLAHHQPTNDRDAERLPKFRPDADPDRQRHHPKNGREGWHQDGTKPQTARLEDCLLRRTAVLALRDECIVNQHDRVLLDDADEKDDPDPPNEIEWAPGRPKREDGADPG